MRNFTEKNRNKGQREGRGHEQARQEIQPAGLTRRFIAYLLDWYVGGLATAFPISVISMKLFETVQNQNIMSFGGSWGMIAGALGVLCGILYYVAVPAFVWRGQTLAKRWLKIKIVKKDGGETQVKNIVMRQLLGLIVAEGSLVTVSTIWHQMASLATGIDFVKILMYVGIAVSFLSALTTLFGEHRALHDRIGGTVVVADKLFPNV